jgi:ATP-dependent DNA helicase RecQ
VQEFARTLGLKGDRQVFSALRILQDYGLARISPAGGASVRVRLIATPQRITRELGEAGRDGEVALLRQLWKAGGGEAVYRGADLEWRDLGPRGRVAPMLDALEAEGLHRVERLERGGDRGAGPLHPVQRLAIDWQGLESKKKRDTRKLQEMQRYAYAEGCRRGFILRYFGDAAADGRVRRLRQLHQGQRRGSPRHGGRRGGPRRAAPPLAAAADEAPPSEQEETLFSSCARCASRWRSRPDPALLRLPGLGAQGVRGRAARPRPEDMLAVPGVGQKTLEKFGHPFLEGDEAARARPPGRRRPGGGAGEPEARAPREAQGGPPRPGQRREAELYARLRALRTDLAKQAKLPPYCVFADRTLVELAKHAPRSEARCWTCRGSGPPR